MRAHLRFLHATIATAGILWLAGCSSDVNPIKALAVGAGYGPRSVDVPEFVTGTRREEMEYMPVGVSAPKRAIRARSETDRKALEAELEGVRKRNEARGQAAEGAARATAQGMRPPELPPGE